MRWLRAIRTGCDAAVTSHLLEQVSKSGPRVIVCAEMRNRRHLCDGTEHVITWRRHCCGRPTSSLQITARSVCCYWGKSVNARQSSSNRSFGEAASPLVSGLTSATRATRCAATNRRLASSSSWCRDHVRSRTKCRSKRASCRHTASRLTACLVRRRCAPSLRKLLINRVGSRYTADSKRLGLRWTLAGRRARFSV